MNIRFPKDFADMLCRTSGRLKGPGLERGKMGAALFLFHCYRITGETTYEDTAEELIGQAYEEIGHQPSMSYKQGLPGVGIGIEYLLRHRFMEGDADEILEETDQLIAAAVRSGALGGEEPGDNLCGVGYYLCRRIAGKDGADTPKRLANTETLIQLADLIDNSFANLGGVEIPDIYFLLKRIHALRVVPFKTRKLLEACRLDLPDPPQVLPGYENLPVPLLTLLREAVLSETVPDTAGYKP